VASSRLSSQKIGDSKKARLGHRQIFGMTAIPFGNRLYFACERLPFPGSHPSDLSKFTMNSLLHCDLLRSGAFQNNPAVRYAIAIGKSGALTLLKINTVNYFLGKIGPLRFSVNSLIDHHVE
jgi:hypothetical protein